MRNKGIAFGVENRRKSSHNYILMMTIANFSTFRGRGASPIASKREQAVFGEKVEERMACCRDIMLKRGAGCFWDITLKKRQVPEFID
jgi:hypothetical protein